jgi:hypothetical protein
MDVQTPETPGRLSLRLDVESPPQVLQIDGRFYHLVLAFPIERDIPDRRAHWDRNRARPAVGEGFPFLLFRSQDGFTVPPWLTFPEAPL